MQSRFLLARGSWWAEGQGTRLRPQESGFRRAEVKSTPSASSPLTPLNTPALILTSPNHTRLQITLPAPSKTPSSQHTSLGIFDATSSLRRAPGILLLKADPEWGSSFWAWAHSSQAPLKVKAFHISPNFHTPFHLFQSSKHLRGEAKIVSLRLCHARTSRNIPTLTLYSSKGTQSCPLPTASGHFPVPILPS